MKNNFLKQFNYTENKLSLSFLIKRGYNSIKHRFLLEPTIFLNKNPYYKQWKIGDYTYGSPTLSPIIVTSSSKSYLEIGKFCSFGYNVIIFLGGNHRPDWVTTYPFTTIFNEASHKMEEAETTGKVTIGNDVWIGEGATIMAGVNIGNGAVIGTKSIVTKDVPPYAIMAGNPAKLIRKRFDDDTIEKLEQLQWWDKPISDILKNINSLLCNNISEFIEKFDINKAESI